MGMNKFISFIFKSLFNKKNYTISNVQVDKNFIKNISNIVLFDISFIIYQENNKFEEQVNDIIKLLNLINYKQIDIYSFVTNNKDNKSYWVQSGLKESDMGSQNSFMNFIINNNKILLFNRITGRIEFLINQIYNPVFIKEIVVFFDGIPSLSKILEQKRRKIRNQLESFERKKLYNEFNLTYDIQDERDITTDIVFYKKYEIINLINKYDTNDNHKKHKFIYKFSNWNNNRFMSDIGIYPGSVFINEFEDFINNYTIAIENEIVFFKPKDNNSARSKISFIIDSNKINGEADIKVFNYIKNKLDMEKFEYIYTIHSVDSDLIYQMLVQTLKYREKMKKVHFNFIKHCNYSYNSISILNSNTVIESISQNFKLEETEKIMLDVFFLFIFFGNDHIPQLPEISYELELEYFINIHKTKLNNITIINKVNNSLNLKNLNILLKEINLDQNNIITKIILVKYFKVDKRFTNLLIDKKQFNFNEILKFLKYFCIYSGKKNGYDTLLEDDIRKKFIDNCTYDIDYKVLYNEYNEIESLLLDNINFYESKYNGLILYQKSCGITTNSVLDIVVINNDLSYKEIEKNYSTIMNNIDIDQYIDKLRINQSALTSGGEFGVEDTSGGEFGVEDTSGGEFGVEDTSGGGFGVEDTSGGEFGAQDPPSPDDLDNNQMTNLYLKKIYHLYQVQYNEDSKLIDSNSVYYPFNKAPTIKNIIHFIDSYSDEELYSLQKQWYSEIINNSYNINDEYINSDNHYKLLNDYATISEDIQKNKDIIDKYRKIIVSDYLKK
jgi:hypothetical protein